MTYERFEDLPVWKAGQELAVGVYELVKGKWFSGKGDLRDQLQRASFSVSANVAEGFERGSTNELIAFLYIARGSVGEVRSGLRFVERLIGKENSDLKSEISDSRSDSARIAVEVQRLICECESVSRQLRKWAEHLQNSDIRGQRHLNEGSREEYDRVKRREAFEEKLRRIRAGGKVEEE